MRREKYACLFLFLFFQINHNRIKFTNLQILAEFPTLALILGNVHVNATESLEIMAIIQC